MLGSDGTHGQGKQWVMRDYVGAVRVGNWGTEREQAQKKVKGRRCTL